MKINKQDIITDTNVYTDNFGNVHNIDKDIEEAEKEILRLKQTATVNFRWSEFEVKRAKKIAQKLGIPYQTYLKKALKEIMDRDEMKFN